MLNASVVDENIFSAYAPRYSIIYPICNVVFNSHAKVIIIF